MFSESEKEEIKRLLEAVNDQVAKNTDLGKQNRAAIEQNRAAIEQNRAAIDKNRASTERNGVDIAFLLQCMNEGHRQILRHIDMAREEARSDMRAFREGMGINRERLDDHESRIEGLESAS